MKNKFQQIKDILDSMEDELDFIEEEREIQQERRRELAKAAEQEQKQDLLLCDYTQAIRRYDAKIERIIEWMDNLEFEHNVMDTAYTIPLEAWGKFRALVEEQI